MRAEVWNCEIELLEQFKKTRLCAHTSYAKIWWVSISILVIHIYPTLLFPRSPFKRQFFWISACNTCEKNPSYLVPVWSKLYSLDWTTADRKQSWSSGSFLLVLYDTVDSQLELLNIYIQSKHWWLIGEDWGKPPPLGNLGNVPPPWKIEGTSLPPWMKICRSVPPLKKGQVNYLLSLNP